MPLKYKNGACMLSFFLSLSVTHMIRANKKYTWLLKVHYLKRRTLSIRLCSLFSLFTPSVFEWIFMKQRIFFFYEADTRYRSRFFALAGHKTTYASTGNKHLCHCQTYQNYQPITQRSEKTYFQSYFSASNISGIILISFFCQKY